MWLYKSINYVVIVEHVATTSPIVLHGSECLSLTDQHSPSMVHINSTSTPPSGGETIKSVNTQMSSSLNGSVTRDNTGIRLANGPDESNVQTLPRVKTKTLTTETKGVPTGRMEAYEAEDVFSGFIVAMHRKMVSLWYYSHLGIISRSAAIVWYFTVSYSSRLPYII